MVWSRIDQKTGLKSIFTAGLVPIVLETVLEGDKVVTGDIETLVNTLNLQEVLCVMTTSSGFAPRVPDDIEKVAKVCAEKGLFHVINNAYGLQCTKITHRIREAVRIGKVDIIVQSTDKNFMVPIGGAIVASQNKEILNRINGLYPGRASISPCLDLFITFLSMGESGYLDLLKARKGFLAEFSQKLREVAEKHGERLLETPENTISFAISCHQEDIGSKLFIRRVSGTRFVSNSLKEVCGIPFQSYGSSYNGYPTSYLTAACAIGITSKELEKFLEKLDSLLD